MAEHNRLILHAPEHASALEQLPFGNEQLAVNSRYFTVAGRPVLPIMGEFHFSRYPAAQWEEELCKIRAGGVQVLATYVFWIHHEQQRGCWDFSGSRDLHAFLSICAKLRMPVVLRIGPFAHGEARNGGLPDWIVNEPSIKERTNDPAYMACARELFQRIAAQAAEFTLANGGPIIGLQLENEYGHVGGPSDKGEGLAHMSALKQMANEYGLTTPFYTATGWGGAYVVDGEMLPVQGGYVDAPWDSSTKELPASKLFTFQPFLDDGNTGSDHGEHSCDEFVFNVSAYPFLTAELGGGLQVTKHRRPVATAADTEALVVCRLGSGANLIGYYMYHGGINPDGILGPDGSEITLQESTATGYPNDLPIKSYDFNAPLKENGELNGSYGRLRKLHMLLADFGWAMAPGMCAYPDAKPESPEDMETPRVSIRHNANTGGGFLFYNNHQRLRHMRDVEQLNVSIELAGSGSIHFPTLDIPSDECGILPYNLPLGNAMLRTANAQPLCRIGDRYFFTTDRAPEFDFADANSEAVPEVLTIKSADANNAFKLDGALYILKTQAEADISGDDSLPISGLYEQAGIVNIFTCRESETIARYAESRNDDTSMSAAFTPVEIDAEATELDSNEMCRRYSIKLGNIPVGKLHEVFLQIDYTGDSAELYQAGKLVADWFTTGMPWRVALERYGYGTEYELRIYAPDRDVYYDAPMQAAMQAQPRLSGVRAIPQYSAQIWPQSK